MMTIFNSLGSNYNLSYLFTALFNRGTNQDAKKLKTLLEEKYGGEAVLLYKGREALSMALKILNFSQDSQVAINGFTCVAVFNAITTAGYNPICLDLEKAGGLNFTSQTLEKEIKRNKKIKIVVVQNTLGYPCEIAEIQKICKKNDIVLIEDLAHCVGTKYKTGEEAGTVGDFVILSFSQDKIIDAVSGGALVVRNKKYIERLGEFYLKNSQWEIKDRLYPLITYNVRFLYPFGLGKLYHLLIKKFGLLSNIMNESFYSFYKLPNWNAMLAWNEFHNLDKNLTHRKKVAKLYASLLPDSIFMFNKKTTDEIVALSSNLRFPIFLNNRSGLIKNLKKQGIYVSDIWYTDVAPECPNAVENAKIIVNLPTHRNVTKKDALHISQIITSCLKP